MAVTATAAGEAKNHAAPNDSNRIPCYTPTPAEVAEGCRRIREEWDEKEHHRRAPHLIPERASLPEVIVDCEVGE